MKYRAALILGLGFLSLASCKGKPDGYHVEEYREVKFEDFSDDIKVPSKMWDLVEFKGNEAHDEHAPKVSRNLIFSDVKVFLVEKNEGIIEGEAVEISLPKGGGNIDLSRFVTNQKGSFYVGFEFPGFEGAKAQKVLFVSATKKRRIGSQVFGAGCNQMFDITDRFLKEMSGEGLKVNTTQDRYLSVLGGTFIFAAQKEHDILLAQVTFQNSQNSFLFCGEP